MLPSCEKPQDLLKQLPMAEVKIQTVSSLAVAATLLLVSALAVADGIGLADKSIVVEGVGNIINGDLATARRTAIQDALKNAVASAFGTYIESSFSLKQRETLKDDQSKLMSDVQESVKSSSKGFIASHKILSETNEGSIFRVKLKAVVRLGPIKDAIKKLKGLLSSVGNPKVMVLTGERFTNQFGKTRRIERPSVTAQIENVLIKKGFEMVDKSNIPGGSELESTLGDAAKAALVAGKFGADVAIVGTAEVKHTAYNEMGHNMYYVSAVINTRAVNVNTGKVMTSFEAVGRGVGANEDLARIKAIRRGAPKVINHLLENLVEVWQREAKNGKRFRVTVANIGHYRKVARPFLKFMRKLPKVSKVKEVSFKNKKLQLDVYFKGDKESFLDAVFEGTENNKKFENLDKSDDSGDSISFTL